MELVVMDNDYWSRNNWKYMSQIELKKLAIKCFFMGEFFGLIFSFVVYSILNVFWPILFFILGSTLFSLYFSIISYKRDWFDNKFGFFYYKNGIFYRISYQGILIFMVSISIVLPFFIFPTALIQGNIYGAFSFSLSAAFPAIFMLLRLNVFSEKITMENNFNDEDSGYMPIPYFLLGISLSTHLIGISLMHLFESIFLNNNFLNNNLLIFIISLLIVCFSLSPDIANKILPFDLKTTDGLLKFFIISFSLFVGGLILLMHCY